MNTIQTIGLLHPGRMGVTVGASIKAGGSRVIWASEGRSLATGDRAQKAGLEDVSSLSGLVHSSDIIISVCPPHAAVHVAQEVMGIGFQGIYADFNAVSPATSRKIERIVTHSMAEYVDGGIIGPPAREPGRTRLYLSGQQPHKIEPLFAKGNMEAIVIGKEAGAASALKMCYAAWTKGFSAMLLAIRALAEKQGVSEALLNEWNKSQPGLADRSEDAAVSSASKAWRFVGEMEEIAATFKEAGLPDQFHLGAAALYKRMVKFKDQTGAVQLRDVIREINNESPNKFE
jgi:3-hydroxyisobutyrate dehydrogenase-like beta-hydroxyacid dehydrogenase